MVERILTLHDLAVLEEKMGEIDNARTNYRRFLEYWGDADLPVPQVAEAKARLAALGDE